jgi:hypothetical protein
MAGGRGMGQIRAMGNIPAQGCPAAMAPLPRRILPQRSNAA